MSSPGDTTPPPQDANPGPAETGLDSEDFAQLDPLLESGSFIEPEPNSTSQGAGGEAPSEPARNEEPRSGSEQAIAAEPISSVGPNASEAQGSRSIRRNPDEMAKRPSWLPENWRIDLRVRTSGVSAGMIDRYYVDPVSGRKFRSKNEVLHYLNTGSTLKRKPSDGDSAEPSESSGKRKGKKPGPKAKSLAADFDYTNPPHSLSWVHTSGPEETWTVHDGNGVVTESTKREWVAAFSQATQQRGGQTASN